MCKSELHLSCSLGQAYLAQSPQLYKQMAIASDFERVFTVGASKSPNNYDIIVIHACAVEPHADSEPSD